MVDLLSIFYGACTFVLLTIIIPKAVDAILGHFLNEKVFSRIWTWMTKTFKKFLTRLEPIKTCFQFRIRFEPRELSEVKTKVRQLIEDISKKRGEQIKFSPLTWNEADDIGSTKALYNRREFGMDIYTSIEYRDFDPEQDILKVSKKTFSSFSDSIAFSIEADFPFQELDQMLLSLSALTSFIKEELNEKLPIIEFSKGMFTLSPLKGDFTVDHWIKEKKFDVSLLLKARERILVNLYPKKAELIFPTLQIDEKVSEYLRGTLLNYYL